MDVGSYSAAEAVVCRFDTVALELVCRPVDLVLYSVILLAAGSAVRASVTGEFILLSSC